jgi:hypothetical protein
MAKDAGKNLQSGKDKVSQSAKDTAESGKSGLSAGVDKVKEVGENISQSAKDTAESVKSGLMGARDKVQVRSHWEALVLTFG